MPGVIERAVENLVAVLTALLPGQRRRRVYVGLADGLVAFGVLIALCVMAAAGQTEETVSNLAMLAFVAGLAALSIGLAVLASFAMRTGRAEETAVGLLWALAIGAGISVLVLSGAAVAGRGVPVFLAVLPGLLPAVLYLLSVHGPLRGVVIALAAALPVFAVTYEMVVAQLAEDGGVAEVSLPDAEWIHALQGDLVLSEAALPPGTPGTPEIFAILGAGYPYEAVFAREVAAVEVLLNERFGAEGRVVTLINDDADQMAGPLLNRVNLRRALDQVSARMDAEDILFLFLTSHGAPGLLSTEFYPLITRDILPGDIAGALDAVGIGNAIIVISACYSGSFVEALAAPDRLILTAAHEDRTSFGCSDEARWTEWGRAFFVDAWPKLRDPRAAARLAQEIVTGREAEQGYAPSEPQIFEGEEIGPALERWLATLE
jgi:hypothetical protein